jgi:hypothetical protein
MCTSVQIVVTFIFILFSEGKVGHLFCPYFIIYVDNRRHGKGEKFNLKIIYRLNTNCTAYVEKN